MSDNLDAFSDALLNTAFAVEVAGFDDTRFAVHVTGTAEYPISAQALPPPFATDANAVLPFLEKRTDMTCYRTSARDWIVKLGVFSPPGKAPSFARAACLALIRAARAKAKSRTRST